MTKIIRSALLGLIGMVFATQAFATVCTVGMGADNCAPPTGGILDLNGTAIPGSYQQYSVNWIATDTTTNISFALRDDPAFVFLDDVTTSDTTTPSGNLISNGGFELGTVGANAPTDWTYLNTFGATYAGVVENYTGEAHSGSNFYFDGAVQAYDGISQQIATTVGDSYTTSFWLMEDSGNALFSDISTNGQPSTGGNGINLVFYAGAVPTLNNVPEPATIALLGVGLAGLGVARRRKA